MDRIITCFDIVEMAVTDASHEFAPDFELNAEAFEILKQYCSIIDQLADNADVESVTAAINPVAMTVNITLVSPDITLYDKAFFELMKCTRKILFLRGDSTEQLKTILIFPSVWKRVHN